MNLLFFDTQVISRLEKDARLSVCPPSEIRCAFERTEPYYAAFPSFFRCNKRRPVADGWLESGFVGNSDGKYFHRYDRVPYVKNELCGVNKSQMSYIGTSSADTTEAIEPSDFSQYDYGGKTVTVLASGNADENYAVGDITTTDEQVISLVIFNKQLAEDLNMESPYKTVLDGDWTLEYLGQTVKNVTADITGEGEINGDDRWGFLGDNLVHFYQAADLSMSGKGADGKYSIDMSDERCVNVLSDIYDFLVTNPNTGSWGMDGHKVNEMFLSGNTLYQMTTLRPITTLRDADVEFGILPLPKYDDTQENYSTPMTANNCPTAAIPIFCADPEMSAVVTEALCYYGYEILTPANYNVYLSQKIARDDESERMLDIIFRTRKWDLAYSYNCNDLQNMINNLYTAGSFNFASSYASFIENANIMFEDIINTTYFNEK